MESKFFRTMEYQAKSRKADLEKQKILFWKHIIITALVCFSICFLAYQANDYFSEHITIFADTEGEGNINTILGEGNYGEIENYSKEAEK